MSEEKKNITIAELIKPYIFSEKGGVTAFPIRCGAGKSTAIRSLIPEIARSGEGIIIVTDRIKRLEDYVSGDIVIEKWVEDNQNKIALLTSENYKQEINRIQYCPILLMTTQRYFHCDPKTWEKYLKWNDGSGVMKPRISVVIDEKPIFFCHEVLNMKSIANVLAALASGLDDMGDQNEKSWCIGEFSQFQSYFYKTLENLQQEVTDAFPNKDSMIYCSLPFDKSSITSNDERFFRTIERNVTKLNEENPKACATLFLLRDIMAPKNPSENKTKERTFYYFRRRSSGKYESCFLITKLYHHRISVDGVNTVILDATANVAPEYAIYQKQHPDQFQIINCDQFDARTDHCTINFIDVPTSRSTLSRNSDSTKALMRIIKDDVAKRSGEQAVIFTYSQIINQFEGYSAQYLGNIRGYNDWRNADTINQIGLMRLPAHFLFLTSIVEGGDNAQFWTEIKGLDKIETRDIIKKYMRHNKNTDMVMDRTIVEDLVQNIFRGTIRNINPQNGNRPYTYNVYCNTTEYKTMIDLLCSLHVLQTANFYRLPSPLTFGLYQSLVRKNRKSKHNDTTPKRIIYWLSHREVGKEFYSKDMLAGVGISAAQLNYTKKSNSDIKKLITALQKTQRTLEMTSEVRDILLEAIQMAKSYDKEERERLS